MISLQAGIASRFAPLLLVVLSLLFGLTAGQEDCEDPGWSPEDLDVKDHTVFDYNGHTYIAAIQLPDEQQFAYARSTDLCSWEQLDPILTERTAGTWDENRIWAPFVFEENGTFYMYYTGVNDHFTQSIMLATTTDPGDPASWNELGVIFQPTHPGAVWSPTSWSNNRDPTVVKSGENYYLLYTGRDTGGGIIGLASAPGLIGPWTDHGATLGPFPGRTLESPTYFYNDGAGYLLYHNTWAGQSFGAGLRSGPAPTGPWSEDQFFFPGWAHEVWQSNGDAWYASYLQGYEISIAPLGWNTATTPPTPFIQVPVWMNYFPMIIYSP